MDLQQNSLRYEVLTQRIHMIICISSANLTYLLMLQTLLHVSSMVSRPSCDFLRTCSIQEPDMPKPFRSASSSLVSARVLNVSLSVCLSIHLLVCLPVCASVCPSVCLSITCQAAKIAPQQPLPLQHSMKAYSSHD